MNELRKCGVDTQWNFTQTYRRMKLQCLQNIEMQLKIIILYKLRQDQKNLIFPLYMDPRFSINMYKLAKKKKKKERPCGKGK